MAFWILWGIDAFIALIFVGFFVIGLGDGSVSSFNIGIWAVILLVLAVVLWGSYALRAKGNRAAAIAVAAVLAVPGILAGILLIATIVLHQRWN